MFKEKQMIKSWHQFERIRHGTKPLLQVLPTLNKPILVAGCQRSGTTAVTRILRSGGDFGELSVTPDDELDAALILAGELPPPRGHRLVLQTTYLNNHYREYFDHKNFNLIWLIRNPREVINSMLNNWSSGALRRLFHACGSRQLNKKQLARYARIGHWGFSKLEMACYSYLEKSHQALEISRALANHQVTFLDYNRFVAEPHETVRFLCAYSGITYSPQIANTLQRDVRKRATNQLSKTQERTVQEICDDAWHQTLKLTNGQERHGEGTR